MNKASHKKKKGHGKVTFKTYAPEQMWLLPPSLEEMIGPNHIVRLVSSAIDGLKLEELLADYQGGGASNYHPKMLLKALVYGYVDKVYSSRNLEKSIKENVCYMWLCANQRPDHNTLNRFRNQLKSTVKEVFTRILLMLIEDNHVNLNNYHIDGTKLESSANKYTYVWAKNVSRHKAGLLAKIDALVEQIERENSKEEQSKSKEKKPKTTNSAALQTTIDELNEGLKQSNEEKKKLARQVKKLEQQQEKLKNYEQQEKLLDGRSSYSKTDPDATFMRMKDDHLGNGQLKPAYNIQIGTSNQFIINYTVHQNHTDFPTFKEHMEETRKNLDTIGQTNIKRCSADAGYGSEDNYDYLVEQGIENYVKYPGFYQENKTSFKQNAFHTKNLYYNASEDYFVCPAGQHLDYKRTIAKESKYGHKAKLKVYQAQNCKGCPMRGMCHKSKNNRSIQINFNLNEHRAEARKNLSTLMGITLKKKRNIDVEAVFGHIKENAKFRRFTLKGLDGISLEFGLLSIAHNIRKWAKAKAKGISTPVLPNFPLKPTDSLRNHDILSFFYTLAA